MRRDRLASSCLTLLTGLALLACSDASFNGASGKDRPAATTTPTTGEQDAAEAKAASPMTTKTTSPAGGASLPQSQEALGTTGETPSLACVNHLKEGLTDARNGFHYKWLGYLSACEGYQACAQLGPSAQIIYKGLAMPDDVGACNDTFAYWYQNYEGEIASQCAGTSPGLALDIVVGGGVRAGLNVPGDIICVF